MSTPTRSRRAWLLPLLAVVAAWIAYRLLSPPRELRLTDACEPRGLVARAQAAVQGPRFWRAQLPAVDREIGWPARMDSILGSARAQAAVITAGNERFMDSIRAAHPGALPPEREPTLPEQLRAQADSIERANTADMARGMMWERAARYAQCRDAVASRGERETAP